MSDGLAGQTYTGKKLDEAKNITGQVKMLAGELAGGHHGENAKAHGAAILRWVHELEHGLGIADHSHEPSAEAANDDHSTADSPGNG